MIGKELPGKAHWTKAQLDQPAASVWGKAKTLKSQWRETGSALAPTTTPQQYAPLGECTECCNTMSLRGESWFIRFRGSREFTVKASIGMRYISILLDRPCSLIPSSHLVNLEACFTDDPIYQSRQEISDATALSDYHSRLLVARDELDIASLSNDEAAVQRLTHEVDAIHAELKLAIGLGGRSREFANADERARKSVQAAIRRSIDTIDKIYTPLARHLDQIQTGHDVVYQPEQDIEWDISHTF